MDTSDPWQPEQSSVLIYFWAGGYDTTTKTKTTTITPHLDVQDSVAIGTYDVTGLPEMEIQQVQEYSL